jgi:hypothetical protein
VIRPTIRTLAGAALSVAALTACGPAAPVRDGGDDRGVDPPDPTVIDTERTLALDDGTVRVGIDKRWGGAVRSLRFGGHELIDAYDGGRLLGVSVYDGGDAYPQDGIRDPSWGWNPTPSDKYDHANPPLEARAEGRALHVRTRNLQWNPDGKGGGPGAGVPSDLVVEAEIRLLADPAGVVRVDVEAAYEGEETHLPSRQEFPFAYVPPRFDRIVRYAGDRPWTGDEATVGGAGFVRASEQWLSFADDDGTGLTVYAPFHYPLFTVHRLDEPPAVDDVGYLTPFLPQGYRPGARHATTVFLIPGTWPEARATAAALRERFDLSDDRAAPFGTIDVPAPGAKLSADARVVGWAIDDVSVAEVEVRLDGEVLGTAHHGLSRPDVAEDYPGLPGAPDFGFAFDLAGRDVTPGDHELEVRLRDAAGNTLRLGPRAFRIEAPEP